MKQKTTWNRWRLFTALTVLSGLAGVLMSSSHREAPLIAYDPQADNTDVYAFRSPRDPNKVVLIANYIPLQLPDGGPIYYNFGENIRYEIHVDNNIGTAGDDIVYRFTFKVVNEDPTTFFKQRLGKENQKTTYTLQRSMDGGKSFTTILSNGKVASYINGPRSILTPVGLNKPSYEAVRTEAIKTASTGEKIFAGPADDPFFVDLGGIFDLGDAPRQNGKSVDGLACYNVSTLAIEVDISTLQKDRKKADQAMNILDPNYVIGVWASASRPKIRTLNGDGTESHSGAWVQVSRLGMPLTNEAVVPIGHKDLWNALTPYQDLANLSTFGNYFYNPELALYMDDEQFGGAVPAFKPLRIQKASLGAFGFANGQDGLYPLKGNAALEGTALDDDVFGKLLLPAPKSPRSVDLWPIFHTGVPNLQPYQLVTGKGGNPLAKGKPFIHNFLPNGGDMLRLNMAVPVTPRNSKDFSSLGLVYAAALGILDDRYNKSTALQNIPNMDGFPNGRRLEDDVTRIELQAVSGIVLAAVGLPYDDYKSGADYATPATAAVFNYTTGVEKNDVAFTRNFPFVAPQVVGTETCNCGDKDTKEGSSGMSSMLNSIRSSTPSMGIAAPGMALTATPNPASDISVVRYHVQQPSKVYLAAYDLNGKLLKVLVNQQVDKGTYQATWNVKGLPKGSYTISGTYNGKDAKGIQVIKQ
jgi:hypothetical protein